MKQLQFLLNSPPKTANFGVAKAIGGRKKLGSNIKVYKFPLALKARSVRTKWFIGEIKWLQRATRKDFIYVGSFQEAIGPISAFAEFFGLMPVVGVKSKSASKMKFQWISIRTIYSLIIFIMSFLYAILTLGITFSRELQFDRMIPLVFYGSAAYGMFLFILLARKWPKIMRRWESIESRMPKYRTQAEKKRLAHHLKILAIIVLMCSLVEHILNLISIVHFTTTCMDPKEPIKEFFRIQLSQLFTILPFSTFAAILGKIVNIAGTFCWNYMDLFLMMVSFGISSRFKQINQDLERVRGEHMSEDYWAARRMQYRKLSGLCIMVDEAIAQITFLSFSNNLFFISVTLLRSIRPMPSIPHAVYFWFSLSFLIGRTLAVSLYSASIHDESKKTIHALRAVPPSSWCTEVRRFCEQVVNDTIAFSGMRFFYLTRRLILTVAGTIITYELVLIQFHTDEQQMDCRRRY